jgi:hypothetical protein
MATVTHWFLHHQSVLLETTLKRADAPVTFYTLKGAGHGGFKDPQWRY